MFKIDNKRKEIKLIGSSDNMVDEIRIAMMALIDQAAQFAPDMIPEIMNGLATDVSITATFLEKEHGIEFNFDTIDPNKKKKPKTHTVTFKKKDEEED